MVDKSWGVGGDAFRVRSNLGAADRAEQRAEARSARTEARAGAIATRLDQRAAAREAAAQAREAARTERRDAQRAAAERDPHSAAARRIRTSGRKDVVREQRDTRHYATTVDHDRIRILARRGASHTGLAAAFGITVEAVEAVLAAE
ncbi:hypothetical protein GCM10011380_32510 [Sphingomonas metalli]|uniref:Uncharacterized protein n=1 Tax=Sphingomonas metalli TaxID=1779358 RepID=A0A916WYZ3_9SPHN|nr:hypothetical protein [Sphingomonas metalli]GGB40532.1 hypothetical protein GCM10011380_32510 [Sphingomonas metalli]